MASASAVEWTATVAMPSSLQARRIRRAISPRLAMRILSNMSFKWRVGKKEWRKVKAKIYSLFPIRYSPLFNDHQRLAELDRLAVLDQDLCHGARARGWNLVHRLHRFDDQQGLSDRHLAADFDERLDAGLGRPIGGADHRRGHHARVFCHVGN